MTASYIPCSMQPGRERDTRDERRARVEARIAHMLGASLEAHGTALDPFERERWLSALARAITEVVEETT